jgi:hypothetical protein
MTRAAIATWCRVLLVAGWSIALSLGTAQIARADTPCAPTDPSCLSGTLGSTPAPSLPPDPTGGTVDHARDQASDKEQTVQDTVSNTENTVRDTVDGILGPGDPDPGPGGGPGGGGTGGSGGSHGGVHRSGTSGSGRVNVPRAGTQTGTSPNVGGSGPIAGRTADDTVHRPTLAAAVAGIALGVIAPLLILIGCTLAFVTLQQRLDGRDPHLAEAPSTPDVAVFG